MKKKLSIISIVSPELEGRLSRTIKLLNEEFDIILYSPCIKEINKYIYKHVVIGENRPKGIREQIRFYNNFKKKINELKISTEYLYVANFTAMPSAKIFINKYHPKTIIYDAYEIPFKCYKEKYNYKERIFNYMEKWLINKSNLIIEANEERALLAQGHYGLDLKPLVLSNMNMQSSNSNLSLMTYNGQIKICYLGFISKQRRIFDLINEVKNKKNITLDIYGYGADSNALKEYIINQNIKNVSYNGAYIYDEINKILSNYQIGFLFYSNKGYNNQYCEPNKILEYASHNIPMISYIHPKIQTIFSKYNIGVCKNSILDAINDIYINISYYKENCRIFCEIQKQLKENEENRFLEVMKNA